MNQKKAIDRRAVGLMAVVVVGTLITTGGINLILVNTGVLTGGTFKTDAVVQGCSSKRTCQLTYERNGVQNQATYTNTPKTYATGEIVRITIYDKNPTKAFPEKVVPLGFALVVLMLGMAILAYGSVRLFRHWRTKRDDEDDDGGYVDLTEEQP